MEIKEIMTKKLITLKPTDSTKEAWDLIFNEHVRHLVVMEKNKVVGIISDRDLLKTCNRATPLLVEDIMSWPVMTVKESTPIEDIIEEVMLQKVSAFLVEHDNGETTGIITTEDLLTYLYMLIRTKNHESNKKQTAHKSIELY
jgi:acetoin utilization protein AcuB